MNKLLIILSLIGMSFTAHAQEIYVTGDDVTFAVKSDVVQLSPDETSFTYFNFEHYLIKQLTLNPQPGPSVFRDPVYDLTDTTCVVRKELITGKLYKAGSIDKVTTLGDVMGNARTKNLYQEYCLRDACDLAVRLVNARELPAGSTAYIFIKEPSIFNEDNGHYAMQVQYTKNHELWVTFGAQYLSWRWENNSPYFVMK